MYWTFCWTFFGRFSGILRDGFLGRLCRLVARRSGWRGEVRRRLPICFKNFQKTPKQSPEHIKKTSKKRQKNAQNMSNKRQTLQLTFFGHFLGILFGGLAVWATRVVVWAALGSAGAVANMLQKSPKRGQKTTNTYPTKRQKNVKKTS